MGASGAPYTETDIMTSINETSTFASELAAARDHIARYLVAKQSGGWHQLPDYPGITDFGRISNGYDATMERRAAKDHIWRARLHARGEWQAFIAASSEFDV